MEVPGKKSPAQPARSLVKERHFISYSVKYKKRGGPNKSTSLYALSLTLYLRQDNFPLSNLFNK